MEIDSAREFCKEWLSTWKGNRPDELIKYYSEKAFYLDPANVKGLNGHEEILPYFKKLLAVNPEWTWEAVEIFPTEKGFTLKWKATIPVGSETVIEQGLDIVEVDDGKITRNEVFFDRSKLLSLIKHI